MAATLSPVTATTFRVINIGSIQISHLAAKTCKLVKLHAECLQLSLVHVAVHRQEEQQHEVLLEALAVEDPLREDVLHDGEGGEGRAGERGRLKERWPHLFLCHSKVSAWVAITLSLPGLEISVSLMVIDFDFWSDIGELLMPR